jgi:hypothetical protein
MGMPINTYAFFEAIAKKQEEELGFWFDFDFTLYGFIVHSPSLAPDFDEELQKSFQKLNLITGEDFLFTSFVDPPKAWIDWIENNKDRYENFTKRFDYSDKGQIKNPKLLLKTLDPSLTALLIAEELGINLINLPFLIVTTHPREKSFYLLQLKKETLLSHMADFTELAATIKMGIQIDVAIKNLGLQLKKIDLEVPLADKLYQLSIKLLEVSRNRKSLENFYVKFSDHRANNFSVNQKNSSSADELNLLFDGYELVKRHLPNAVNKNPKIRKGNSEDFDLLVLASCLELTPGEVLKLKEYLEPATFSFLAQGAKLKLIYSDFFGDTGPFILPFGKAFELEMSYSLVHWIRREYDIQLPRYFYEYQPNIEVILGDQPGYDFNSLKEKSQEWRPPMLAGQLTGLVLTNRDKQVHPFDSDFDLQHFLDLGFRLKNLRNNACHPNTTTEDDLIEIIGIWKELFSKGVMEKLFELKSNYRI